MVVQFIIFLAVIILCAFIIYLGAYTIADNINKPMDKLNQYLDKLINHTSDQKTMDLTIRFLVQILDKNAEDFVIDITELTEGAFFICDSWNEGKEYAHTEDYPIRVTEIMPVEDESVKRSVGSEIIQVRYTITIPEEKTLYDQYIVTKLTANTSKEILDSIIDSFDDDEKDSVTDVSVTPIGFQLSKPN